MIAGETNTMLFWRQIGQQGLSSRIVSIMNKDYITLSKIHWPESGDAESVTRTRFPDRPFPQQGIPWSFLTKFINPTRIYLTVQGQGNVLPRKYFVGKMATENWVLGKWIWGKKFRENVLLGKLSCRAIGLGVTVLKPNEMIIFISYQLRTFSQKYLVISFHTYCVL